jgi:deazaflavin-dependent oxidoreductase (nitroreductase family)
VSDFNKKIIEEFRANDGVVGGHFEGATLLLLHTTGAKSGKPHINPVTYFKDGERYVIVASNQGGPNNPDWYYNLIANPKVNVEVGAEQFDAVAELTSEPERTQLYEKMEARRATFSEYKKQTSRSIPVVILKPKA